MTGILTDLRVLVYDGPPQVQELETLEYRNRVSKKLVDLGAFAEVIEISKKTKKATRNEKVSRCDVLVITSSNASTHALLLAGAAGERGKLIAMVTEYPVHFAKYLNDPFDAIGTYEEISTWLMVSAPFAVKHRDNPRADSAWPDGWKLPKVPVVEPSIPDKPDLILQAVYGHVNRLDYMATIVYENAGTIEAAEQDNVLQAPGMLEMFGHLRDEVARLGVHVNSHVGEANPVVCGDEFFCQYCCNFTIADKGDDTMLQCDLCRCEIDQSVARAQTLEEQEKRRANHTAD